MAKGALLPRFTSRLEHREEEKMLNDFAISVRARAIVDEEVEAPQIVRNTVSTMAYE
jgi:hypothetical protein